MQDFVQVLNAGDILIAVRMSISSPSEIYSIDLASGTATNISNINTPVLSQLTLGDVEERWVKTTDGKDMLVWVIYPPHFDPSKKYPAILYCQEVRRTV